MPDEPKHCDPPPIYVVWHDLHGWEESMYGGLLFATSPAVAANWAKARAGSRVVRLVIGPCDERLDP